jgi:hypothetical protein
LKSKYSNLGFSLLAAIATFILYFPFARIGVDFHHDGVIFKPAFDVSLGQVLFRDSFSQYGALSTYLHALCLQILPSLLSLRLFTVTAYSITVFFLFSSWLVITTRKVSVLGLLIFWLMTPFYDQRWLLLPWPSVVALMFQSMSIYFLLKTILNSENYIWATLLGLSVGFTFWARPVTVGIGLIFSILAFLIFLYVVKLDECKKIINDNKKQSCFGLLSFFMANLFFLIPILLHGSFSLWLDQQFFWPCRGYSSGNLWGSSWLERLLSELRPIEGLKVAGLFLILCAPYFILNLFRKTSKNKKTKLVIYYSCLIPIALVLLHRAPGFLLFPEGWSGKEGGIVAFLCIVFVCGSTWMFLKLLISSTVSIKDILIYALVIISATSLLQFYPTFSLPQLFWSLAPLCGLISYFIWRFCRFKAAIALPVSIAILLPSVIQRTLQGWDNLSRPLVEIKKPFFLAGMRVEPNMAKLISDIESSLQEFLDLHPDRPIAIIGDDAMYCLFAKNKANLTPYYVTWNGLMSEHYAAKRNEIIFANRPVVIFCSSLNAVHDQAVNEFMINYNYRQIYAIGYRPVSWWFGGQSLSIAADSINNSAKTSARILVPN